MATFDQFGRRITSVRGSLPHHRSNFDQFGRRVTSASASALRNSSHSQATTSSSRSNANWWQRLNYRVQDFGDWYDDHYGTWAEWILYGALILGLIGLIIAVVATFITQGILEGILAGVIALISGLIGYFIVFILYFLLSIVLYAIRFVFLNIYTLLITLAVGGYLLFGPSLSNLWSDSSDSEPTAVEVAAPQQAYCTARKGLNVRQKPSKKGRVIGKLYYGQKVNIYGTEDGFTEVEYNGVRAYASSRYIKPITPDGAQ